MPLADSFDEETITREVLSYRAPYLEARLLRLGVVHTAAEAEALFVEVKKYRCSPRTNRPRFP
jgi:hypothetical protein